MLENDYGGHGVWQILSDVEFILGGFPTETQHDERYYEIREKLDYLKWVLETNNSAFVAASELQQTENELNQVKKFLANDDGNLQNYENIANQFSSIFSRFPYPRLKNSLSTSKKDFSLRSK